MALASSFFLALCLTWPYLPLSFVASRAPVLFWLVLRASTMSSFTDPSSIVLIVGALFIIIFLVHGLWFSNKPQNRRLKKNDQRDQELSRSEQIGKVRIVTPDSFSATDGDDLDSIATIKKSTGSSGHGKRGLRERELRALKDNDASLRMPDVGSDSYDESLQNTASISVNPKTHGIRTEPSLNAYDAGLNVDEIYQPQAEPDYAAVDAGAAEEHNVYEIIIVADPESPFLGEDIEEICNQYGFIQGYIQDNLKIYFVYENAREKTNEVFRICSMEQPYYFPENMQGYQTSAIALYMTLPPQGKAFAYFKALRMATEIFINQLGGHMEDQHNRVLTTADLDALAAELQAYDNANM